MLNFQVKFSLNKRVCGFKKKDIHWLVQLCTLYMGKVKYGEFNDLFNDPDPAKLSPTAQKCLWGQCQHSGCLHSVYSPPNFALKQWLSDTGDPKIQNILYLQVDVFHPSHQNIQGQGQYILYIFLKSQRHLGTTSRTTALENSSLITKVLQSRANSIIISPLSIYYLV